MSDFEGHNGTFSKGSATVASGAERTKKSLRIEFGRRKLSAEEARSLAVGNVVSLESAPTDEVDVYLDGRLIARGEPAVFEGKMCVRVTQVVRDAATTNK